MMSLITLSLDSAGYKHRLAECKISTLRRIRGKKHQKMLITSFSIDITL